jgi:hypothetical protein
MIHTALCGYRQPDAIQVRAGVTENRNCGTSTFI